MGLTVLPLILISSFDFYVSQNNILGQSLMVVTQHPHPLSAKPIVLPFRPPGLAQCVKVQYFSTLVVTWFLRFLNLKMLGKR